MMTLKEITNEEIKKQITRLKSELEFYIKQQDALYESLRIIRNDDELDEVVLTREQAKALYFEAIDFETNDDLYVNYQIDTTNESINDLETELENRTEIGKIKQKLSELKKGKVVELSMAELEIIESHGLLGDDDK